jgi:hypothetical protein
MKTVIVAGALANKPFNGGNAWSRLGWVLGFRKLGFEICFVEMIDSNNCVDSNGERTTFENSVNLTYFRVVMEQFELTQCSALICDGGAKVHGLSLRELARRAPHALLFNISGHFTHPEILGGAGCRVYYDDDPGFTQFWDAAGYPVPGLGQHDFYFTIGENIGKPDCSIPTNGIDWKHTRPPVVLEDWPSMPASSFDRFTTVASWRGAYAPVEYDGKRYGVKAHEFRRFIEVPVRSKWNFEVALQIDPPDQGDIDRLAANRWNLIDPIHAAGSPEAFRKYVQNSGAEFSVAQGVYVGTRSGWFSDRTVRYLASGRPALVQDTGFTQNYPAGEGLLAFSSVEEALDSAERIVRDYDDHCRAARQLAEAVFDSGRVIRQLASEIGLDLP